MSGTRIEWAQRRPSRAVGTLAVFALALAACGGKEEPAAPAAPSAQAPAGAAPAPVASPAATPAPEVAQLPVEELLKRANAAVNEQRLVAPAGDNAIEYYVAVKDQDANNVQATQALVDIFPLAASIAEREIAQRRVEEAERIVGLLDRASPNSYTVSQIRTKLDALKTTLQREQEAQLAAQQAAAQQAAQAAASPTPSPSPVAAAPRPTPSPTPTPAATPAADPVAAAPTPTPSPAGGETRDARVASSVAPTYPPQAARKRQEGWVEIELVIGVDGRVKSASVIRAQPARVFDREALRAVQRWTFEPALRNGQPVESRSRQRIQFTL